MRRLTLDIKHRNWQLLSLAWLPALYSNLLTGLIEPSKTSTLAAGSESRARCLQSCWEGQ